MGLLIQTSFGTQSGFGLRGDRTEFFWKRDIELGGKALRLKAKQATQSRTPSLGSCHSPKSLETSFPYMGSQVVAVFPLLPGRDAVARHDDLVSRERYKAIEDGPKMGPKLRETSAKYVNK